MRTSRGFSLTSTLRGPHPTQHIIGGLDDGVRTHARARAPAERGRGLQSACARRALIAPLLPRSPSLPPAVVEWVLARKGAVETELEDDPREARASRPAGYGAGRGGGGGGGGGAGGRGRGGDDDDDEEDEEEEGSAGGRRR